MDADRDAAEQEHGRDTSRAPLIDRLRRAVVRQTQEWPAGKTFLDELPGDA